MLNFESYYIARVNDVFIGNQASKKITIDLGDEYVSAEVAHASLSAECKCLPDNEHTAPDYYVIDGFTADHLTTENYLGCYDWTGCTCTSGCGGIPCGSCPVCQDVINDQDIQYLIDNALDNEEEDE